MDVLVARPAHGQGVLGRPVAGTTRPTMVEMLSIARALWRSGLAAPATTAAHFLADRGAELSLRLVVAAHHRLPRQARSALERSLSLERGPALERGALHDPDGPWTVTRRHPCVNSGE